MRLGILGSGKIVEEFLTVIDKLDFESVDILSTERSKEKAEKMAKDFNLRDTYTDYDKMLKSDIDTVYLALPNFLHFEYAKKAILAGKNVICEKPITSTFREFIELKELALKKKLFLIEAVTIHEMPSYISLKEKIKELGDLKLICLNYSQYSSRYNAFMEGKKAPVFDYHKSGGVLYDLNVYNVNFVVGLFGKPVKISYTANVKENVDTSGIMVLEYPGFRAVLVGAKDTETGFINAVEGTKAHIEINMPVSRMTGYKLIYNKKISGNSIDYENVEYKNTGYENIEHEDIEYKDKDKHHAMYYEFTEFKRMIENKDYGKMNELLSISETVSYILEKGRKDAGIYFDADMK